MNLGILNQISNPSSNGKGGKITYRNNYPRIGSNTNNSNIISGAHGSQMSMVVSTTATGGGAAVPNSSSISKKVNIGSAERMIGESVQTSMMKHIINN